MAVAATTAYNRGLRRLTAGLGTLLVAEWADLGSYDREDVPRWEAMTAATAAAFAEESAALAVGYVSTVADVPTPTFQRPPLIADPEIPFLRHWRGLNDGKPWETSVDEASGAVREYASDVVHSTARDVSDQVAPDRIVGWRRVLNGVSCEWCALVATQRYRSAQSANFGHASCDCGVAPITGDVDPGRVINSDLLQEMKAQGTPDQISRNRQARRSLQAADNAAARRDRALSELADETDPTRRRRLEERARRWEREAEAFRARAAESAAPSRSTKTGYVDPQGKPAPRP